ncbi:hypothetical protein [Bacillus horti]|uniref:ImmA/IrrE family metallo-endopeptidase n=1 Tax=Caldalkalibacillus horti TaxID=77523 RepID=A0ABT9W1S9_9BACI|nr:hypothetical protein [Bacillus horti]MDQ0166800.1 hypothetical protein [Bacillus horti]
MLKGTKNKAVTTTKVGNKKKTVHTQEPTTFVLQKALGNHALQSIIQRSIMIGEEHKPYSALETWNLLVQERSFPTSAQSSVMEVLLEWDEEDREFTSLDEIEEELGGYEVEVQGENVFFEFSEGDDQIQLADDIIMALFMEYGISFNSRHSFLAIKNSLRLNKEEIGQSEYKKRLKRLDTRTKESWLLEDLKALLEALKYFSPILGRRRVTSPRADFLQEITSFGKIDEDVDFGHTLAETFKESGHIVMYDEGTNEVGEEPSYSEKVDTFVHELTHGLLEHRLDDFKENVPFWTWIDQQERHEERDPSYNRPDYDGEKPPTQVAVQAVHEDFAESVMLFFRNRKNFRMMYPVRSAIVSRIIEQEFGVEL